MKRALPLLAWLRELPKGNARAAVEKGRGILEGLRVPLRAVDSLGTPAAGSGDGAGPAVAGGSSP